MLNYLSGDETVGPDAAAVRKVGLSSDLEK
jgi:hypothetical protein